MDKYSFIDGYTPEMGLALDAAEVAINNIVKPKYISGWKFGYDAGGPWPDGCYDDPSIRFVILFDKTLNDICKLDFLDKGSEFHKFFESKNQYKDEAESLIRLMLSNNGVEINVMGDLEEAVEGGN